MISLTQIQILSTSSEDSSVEIRYVGSYVRNRFLVPLFAHLEGARMCSSSKVLCFQKDNDFPWLSLVSDTKSAQSPLS